MGISIVPPGDAPLDVRVEPDKVWYTIVYAPKFPMSKINGKLDKDYAGDQKWILGLLEDVRRAGKFLNPVIVWNHHPNRLSGKQPTWLLRAGSNRVWCAEQLRWTHVPALVSVTDTRELEFLEDWRKIEPQDAQALFVDGGNFWANDFGMGLLRAKKPELTYADFEATAAQKAAVRPTSHGRTNIERVVPLARDEKPR